MDTTQCFIKDNIHCIVNNGRHLWNYHVNSKNKLLFLWVISLTEKKREISNRSFLTKTDNAWILCCSSCGFLWIQHKSSSISCWGLCGWSHVKLIAYNVQLRSVLSNKAGQPFVCLDHHRCCTLHGMPGQGLIFCRLINHHKEGSKLHTTLVVNLITRRSDCQMALVWDRDDKYWPAAERQALVLGRKGWSIPHTLLG